MGPSLRSQAPHMGADSAQRPGFPPVPPFLPEPLLRPSFLSCRFPPISSAPPPQALTGWVRWCLGGLAELWGAASLPLPPSGHALSCFSLPFLPWSSNPTTQLRPSQLCWMREARDVPPQAGHSCHIGSLEQRPSWQDSSPLGSPQEPQRRVGGGGELGVSAAAAPPRPSQSQGPGRRAGTFPQGSQALGLRMSSWGWDPPPGPAFPQIPPLVAFAPQFGSGHVCKTDPAYSSRLGFGYRRICRG